MTPSRRWTSGITGRPAAAGMNHGRDRDTRQQGTAMLDMLMTRATGRLGPY